MFLIDCVDKARFGESKTELDSLLTDEQLANCPVLILGNKIDIPGAVSGEEPNPIIFLLSIKGAGCAYYNGLQLF